MNFEGDLTSSVGGRSLWVDLDTAGTIRAVHAELDVTLVTPGGVPRVLDEPVVLSILGTIADGEDGVIEVGSALGGGEDTGLVGLEDELVGLDGNGERLIVEGSLHLGAVGWGDVDIAGDLNGSGGEGLSEAGGGVITVSRGVWVDGLELSGVALVVVVGTSLETTIAAQVAVSDGGAVNELLLGEGEELTSGNEVGTFDGTSGGESPAGTAGALVLDAGDGTSLNPVDGVGVGLLEDLDVLDGGLVLDVTKHLLVFNVVPVGELVVSSDVALSGIDLLNGHVGGNEVLESGVEVVHVDVALAPLGDVLKVGEGECVDHRDGYGVWDFYYYNC